MLKTFKSFINEAYNKNLYYIQPDGSWKKGGDGRSVGKKREELSKSAKIQEVSRYDLNSKYQGLSTDEIRKRSKDNRKYSPAEREALKKELQMRSQVREDALPGAPANNTTSVPGAGSDNTLHMKKMRAWKKIYRRHKLPEVK